MNKHDVNMVVQWFVTDIKFLRLTPQKIVKAPVNKIVNEISSHVLYPHAFLRVLEVLKWILEVC